MQPIDIEAWKELLIKRELEAIAQMSTMRTLMARIKELESQQCEGQQSHYVTDSGSTS